MSDGSTDTFPRLLLHQAAVRADQPAMREKDLGIWQTWTWGQVGEEVRALACGLAELGFKRGDNLAIIGDNRPRLYWAMAAAQCLGGVPVPMYQDAVAQELLFVLQDAEISFAVVEDQEQVDKLLGDQGAVPAARAHPLRRTARHAPLRPAVPAWPGRGAGDGAHPHAQAAGFHRRRNRTGRPRGRGDHALHLGHHRQAQRRVPDPRGFHHRGEERRRFRPSRTPRTISSPTCRWPGSATTCSPMARRWSPDSPSTARNRATR